MSMHDVAHESVTYPRMMLRKSLSQDHACMCDVALDRLVSVSSSSQFREHVPEEELYCTALSSAS